MDGIRIHGSINGIGFVGLVDLGYPEGCEGVPGMYVGLDTSAPAPGHQFIQVEFDQVKDCALVSECLECVLSTLEPVFVGKH